VLDATRVRAVLEAVLRTEADLSESEARDVAFHLTDWLGDLEQYYMFCKEPGCATPAEVQKLVIDFLVHVPNHVAAASKLLTGIPVSDIFGVGATSEDQGRAG
jgi:hypothetical protein